MSYLPIHDYGIVGDMNSCALIGRNGSIDWACFPRFDSPSVFAAVLDDERGGRFQLEPASPYTASQAYLPETNVLETTFTTGAGVIALLDFMPLARPSEHEAPHELHRIVRGVSGEVEVRVLFQPRLGYASTETSLQTDRGGVVASGGSEHVALVSSIQLQVQAGADGGPAAIGAATLRAGDEHSLIAAWGRQRTPSLAAMDVHSKLARTTRIWEAMSAKLEYDGDWRDWVLRSFLALHLLIYEPSGAIVAAPTTSLPEWIGSGRNWDYRFSWLRDAAWTAGILFRLGDPHEGEAFMAWLTSQCSLDVERMQILHGISPESDMREVELPHLTGYRGSAPVRVGNDAAFHRQLDVFGELALSLVAYHKHHGDLTNEMWSLIHRIADLACQTWHMRDRSIWEVRGPERHFVYSKLMCWVALDRACSLAQAHGYEGPIDRWREQAERVKTDILEHGWSEERQSFVQHYETDAVDASALLIPFVGFLEADDARVASTVRRVQRELAEGPFVRRYRVEETDDGLEGEEGSFYILSFWLIGALLAIGAVDEAASLFDQVRETASPLGLFAEMYDAHHGIALGNFPQAFSHIGLIHTARNLSNVLRQTQAEELLS